MRFLSLQFNFYNGYLTSFRCDGGGVDDRRHHDDHTVYPQHVLRFNCMIHSHTRDYGLFASLLGASERTLHHFILCLGTTRTLLTACKLHRGVRAPPREVCAVALLSCCPTQLVCVYARNGMLAPPPLPLMTLTPSLGHELHRSLRPGALVADARILFAPDLGGENK